MSFGTQLTSSMAEAQKYVDEKKFDLALKKADEMQEALPGFVGSVYVRYLVNKSKGYVDETAKYAEEIIKAIPNDNRIEDVYATLINYYLTKDRKKEAEDLAIRALSLWPDDPKLKESFKKIFGYLPSSLKMQ